MSGLFRGPARTLAAAFALTVFFTLPAAAYEPPSGTVVYVIHHSKYKNIGTHSLTFSRSGKELIVDVTVKIKVKVLFIPVHSLESTRKETWLNGRLMAYTAHTKENREKIDVLAGAVGRTFVVEGPDGRAETDGLVFPTNPWNPDIVKATLLMDTKTGELLKVSVAAAGEDSVEVSGKAVKTRKYVISGDLDRELWFDKDGNLIRFRFLKDGKTLTFTRATPMP